MIEKDSADELTTNYVLRRFTEIDNILKETKDEPKKS
jgi:hypothetical protein